MSAIKRVKRLTGDIAALTWNNRRTVVNRLSRSVEDATEHIAPDRRLHDVHRELAHGVLLADSGSAFENLNHGLVFVDREDLTAEP
jgi:hypothetical protein